MGFLVVWGEWYVYPYRSVDEPAQIAFDPESFADAVHSLLG